MSEQVASIGAFAVRRLPSRIESTSLSALSPTLPSLAAASHRLFCSRCRTSVAKLVCPNGFQMLSVAVVCSLCGRVHGYIDDPSVLQSKNGRPPKDSPPREFVVSHRIARNVYRPDEQREAVLLGLREHVDVKQIAEDIGVSVEYVHAIGVNEGLLAAASLLQPEPIHVRTVDKVAALHREGKNAAKIAEELNVQVRYVNILLRRAIAAGALPAKRTQADQIRARFALGERQCDIAKELGVAPCYVSVVVNHPTNLAKKRIRSLA